MSEQFFLSFLARLLHCSVTPAGFLSPQLPGSANPCCACCVALRFSSFSATFAVALSVSQVAHPVPHGMLSDPLSGELHDSGAFTICKKAPHCFPVPDTVYPPVFTSFKLHGYAHLWSGFPSSLPSLWAMALAIFSSALFTRSILPAPHR